MALLGNELILETLNLKGVKLVLPITISMYPFSTTFPLDERTAI